MTIIFESHGTTIDNEQDIASGHADVELSALGEQQARELGERYRGTLPDAVFCSDLQRSYRTAEIAFAGKSVEIIRDARLRECDYGKYTQQASDEVDKEKPNRVFTPFPGGQSYAQTTELMNDFLNDIKATYYGKTVMIIGHRATQYALEHIVKGVDLHTAVTAPWEWQPGWVYTLE